MHNRSFFRVGVQLWAGLFLFVLSPRAQQSPAKDPPSFDLPGNVEELRAYYLQTIDRLRDYRAGKSSYVESPERRLGHHQASGATFTLLDIEGSGSIRHLWSTFQPGKGENRLHFYIDGAPAMSGTMSELIEKAKSKADVPVPGFIGRNHAYNLFAPVPFEKSARIVMETIDPVWILFYQIDYRTDVNDAPSDKAIVEKSVGLKKASSVHTILPGETAVIFSATGPAVVRQWKLKTDAPFSEHRRIDLSVRYEGSPTDAVATTLGDFFGPFRGVALDSDEKSGTRTSYLPMPFGRSIEIQLRNRTSQPVTINTECLLEKLPSWPADRGYFHALGQTSAPTVGYRQHQVLYLRGRGHWLGMSLFNTGHDHGGGDFAVIDGEGKRPAFLHGINGEDYFTFAWFGQGANHPFAVAHPNVDGRIRLHFENPYPFQESFSLYWGVYPNLTTRSVAYWYQDSPHDTTIPDEENPLNAEWDCFGPVRLPLDEKHEIANDFVTALPSVADLDAGKTFECRLIEESFVRGWMKQLSIGPMLDLTYLARHGTRVRVESELGGMGHAFLARRRIDSAAARTTKIQFSHDDPVRVLVNGAEVYRAGQKQGFATVEFPVTLQAGKNEIVVQLVNQFNVNFNWAGFGWRELPAAE